ncbi:MAG: crossover junction endodeoxyribonuclease RuvC, partial [Bacteroidales bacterium]
MSRTERVFYSRTFVCVKGMQMESQIIMGIDPGLANTGWGIIRCGGTHVAPVAYGCITTTKSHDLPTRLAIIHDNLLE